MPVLCQNHARQPSKLSLAFSIWRVRPHTVADRLLFYCDGSLAIVQGELARFVEGPEFLLVELACRLGVWLATPEGTPFAYTTSDEEEGPTLTFAPASDGGWQLSAAFVHTPGAFSEADARQAARRYIRTLEERLQVLGFSMAACPPPDLAPVFWEELLRPA